MAAEKSFGWDECQTLGDVGVTMLTRHLQAKGRTVKDVTASKPWQKRDVDLLMDGWMVECKTDSHKPTNIFLELSSGEKPGWTFISRADVLCIVFPESKLAYWIDLPQLQYWFARHLGDYKPILIHSHRQYETRTARWDIVGIAVPVADLKRDGVPVDIIRFDEEEADGGRDAGSGPKTQDRGRVAGRNRRPAV